MATFKTVTFTEEEWVVLSLALRAQSIHLRRLIDAYNVSACKQGIHQRLLDLDALIERLGD